MEIMNRVMSIQNHTDHIAIIRYGELVCKISPHGREDLTVMSEETVLTITLGDQLREKLKSQMCYLHGIDVYRTLTVILRCPIHSMLSIRENDEVIRSGFRNGAIHFHDIALTDFDGEIICSSAQKWMEKGNKGKIVGRILIHMLEYLVCILLGCVALLVWLAWLITGEWGDLGQILLMSALTLILIYEWASLIRFSIRVFKKINASGKESGVFIH